MRKIFFAVLFLAQVFSSPISYASSLDLTVEDLPKIQHKSSVKAYLNNYYIDSWIINESLFIDINEVGPYGYTVLYSPDKNQYYLDYKEDANKEASLRELQTSKLTSYGIEDSWYADWIESIDPTTYYYRSTSGGMIHDIGTVDLSATVTFEKDIPLRFMTSDYIRIYLNDDLDVTKYFALDFHAPKNRLTITPTDDILFKLSAKEYPSFTVQFSDDIEDSLGNKLGIPISHTFRIEEQRIDTPKVDKESTLSRTSTRSNIDYEWPFYEESEPLYQYNDRTLISVERFGQSVWDEQKKKLHVENNFISKFPDLLKMVTTDRYSNIFQDITLPYTKEVNGNNIMYIPSVEGDEIAQLTAPLAMPSGNNPTIQLKNLITGKLSYPITTENIIAAPDNLSSDVYALILTDGLVLKNGSTINNNIYYILYISNTP